MARKSRLDSNHGAFAHFRLTLVTTPVINC